MITKTKDLKERFNLILWVRGSSWKFTTSIKQKIRHSDTEKLIRLNPFLLELNWYRCTFSLNFNLKLALHHFSSKLQTLVPTLDCLFFWQKTEPLPELPTTKCVRSCESSVRRIGNSVSRKSNGRIFFIRLVLQLQCWIEVKTDHWFLYTIYILWFL